MSLVKEYKHATKRLVESEDLRPSLVTLIKILYSRAS